MTNTLYVSSAKPKAGGAIWTAPYGTDLPTDAKMALDVAFKQLGYISEDGLSNENTIESENIKAWGGDVVNSIQTERSDRFKFALIEGLNIDVLKEVYGNVNVTGTIDTGITVKANSFETMEHCLVIDTNLKGGVLKRIVIPMAKLVELDEIVYKDNENISYGITIQALPDRHQNTHYEYIVKGGQE